MTDVSVWYKNLPIFTKYWLSLTVGISLLARFGLLAGEWLYLAPYFIYYKFQLWRLVTCIFYYPLTPNTGFHFMLNCYFLYNYSLRLETDHFKSSPGDYFFLLLFNWACCTVIGLLFNLPLLMDPLILSVLYIWCQLNKNVIVNFWFGTRFKAMYLPWVLLGFNLILSSGSMYSLVGILVGHLYFFLKIKYPQELGGPSYLNTPAFIKSYFPDVRGGVHGFGFAPQNQRTDQPAGGGGGGNNQNRFFGGNNWGRGQRLGRD
ncbi:derlin-1 isoform X2 [Sitodiplosis mosellana]|uniref:derlin-1 isoform X2 n=1 Tax=Sitodiplosis mosellana TaxID=263140 RepID=UPI002443BF6B|nr:derlin-1 isoform X2 [Sitodiplosis mosellana]